MRSLLIIVLFISFGCTACSGTSEDKWTKQRPETYPVTGTVNFEGKPLEGATIVFRSSSGEPQAAVGRSNAEGEFQLRTFEDGDGAIAGEHTVSITCVKTEGPPAGANLDEVDVVVKEVSLIPEKYGDFKKSGLSAKVSKENENVFNFDLENKK
ncbi:DUF4198 domain-containing protein [Gimesia aquarii]|uniref:Carboxypeptidase regulatory-like domain-containing protein n=1 Tax=Gimesia aquarii TaxID=2527964 RepID=A0A517W0X1_9PLAN|nr:DUF4198 domain-containing protein [Gimesia aquarii]QDT98886.1 hypothetical protein V144x_43960 [Gimesia aquarii]